MATRVELDPDSPRGYRVIEDSTPDAGSEAGTPAAEPSIEAFCEMSYAQRNELYGRDQAVYRRLAARERGDR